VSVADSKSMHPAGSSGRRRLADPTRPPIALVRDDADPNDATVFLDQALAALRDMTTPLHGYLTDSGTRAPLVASARVHIEQFDRGVSDMLRALAVVRPVDPSPFVAWLDSENAELSRRLTPMVAPHGDPHGPLRLDQTRERFDRLRRLVSLLAAESEAA
jgi:hypothetical protein